MGCSGMPKYNVLRLCLFLTVNWPSLLLSSVVLSLLVYSTCFGKDQIKYSKYTANMRFLQAGEAFCRLSNGYSVAGHGILLN